MSNSIFGTHKIMLCHMVIIYLKQHMTCLWKQCVHIHHQNMHYRIGILCCVMYNGHELILQVHNMISTISILLLQYIFMFITYFQVVMCKEDALSMKINGVNCVRLTLIQN